MPNCKSCDMPFEIQMGGYHSGLCDKCKASAKEWLLADPVFTQIAAEYGRRYGHIWLDGLGGFRGEPYRPGICTLDEFNLCELRLVTNSLQGLLSYNPT